MKILTNPLLIPMVGHGATDIVDLPKQTLLLNLGSALVVHPLNLQCRQALLVGFSIFHIAQDITIKNNIKYFYSFLLHIIWITNPPIALFNLACIHTPLHYRSIYINSKKQNAPNLWKAKYAVGAITSIIADYAINNNIVNILDIYLGELWWLSPVVSHIILTHIINSNITNYS